MRNEIHNCECRIGLLEWWLKKYRGVKWHLVFHINSFQFVHNHRNYSLNGRFVITLDGSGAIRGQAGLIT